MSQEWIETPRKIIIIDDNQDIHNDFRTLLLPKEASSDLNDLESELFGDSKPRPAGPVYQLDFALQGNAGVEIVRTAREEGAPFALAFVDMRMPPGWDGFETIIHLWEVDPDIQVVLCTAYSDHSWEEIANRFPDTDSLLILKKPFAIEEVAQLARAFTSKWLLAKEVARKIEDLDTQLTVRTGSLQRVYAQLVHDMEELEQTRKDCTALQEQLRQTQRIESIGLLAGGIAHEFNKLLTPITGYADLILSRLAPDDKLHNKANEILKAALIARDLTQQLLAFSGNQELNQRVIHPGRLVAEFTDAIKQTLGPGIELTLDFAQDLDCFRVDPIQFQQVLLHLAKNARNAMPNGGVLILGAKNAALDDDFCRANAAMLPGGYIVFTAQDTGRGMSPETLAHIFEPFFTTSETGTGLGLAAVHGIVRQHGGAIRAESLPGAGTTFRIYLPAVNEEERDSR